MAIPINLLKEGMYFTEDDRIAKVQRARGSNRLYAKLLNVATQKFDYEKGLIFHLKTRMTVDDAIMFGKQTGICCVCGRTLTNSLSIELGIGPICRSRI